MVTFIKESSIGDIIADTFKIYARNFGALFLICLVPMGPFELLKAIGVTAGNEILAGFAGLLSFCAGVFVYGAVTVAVSDICLGNPPSVTRSFQAVFRVLGRYIKTYLLVVVLFIVGLMLLVVPGIIVLLFYLFALPIAVIERKGAIDSMKRSRELGKGFYWRNLGVLLVAGIVAGLVMLLIFAVMIVLFVVLGADADDLSFNILMSLGSILSTPVLQIPLILLYYDMRVRKEFFDGSALEQEMFA